MIARASLLVWALKAAALASHGQRELAADVAGAMVDAAIANPLTSTDEGLRTTLAIEVALAWWETGGQLVLDPKGPNDGGRSHCWAQIYLANGARTLEGWTGLELRTDAAKCATVAVRIIKASVVASPVCDGCELVMYARGRDTAEARALSRHRVALAKRLIREVPLEVAEGHRDE